MVESLDLHILEHISVNSDLTAIANALVDEMAMFLDLNPYYKITKVTIGADLPVREPTFFFFDRGVRRSITPKGMFLELIISYERFFPFIMLREVYLSFVPPKISEYEDIQLTITQILLNDLSTHPLVNKWRIMMREQFERIPHLSVGWSRLEIFDRVDNFFRINHPSFNPVRYFLRYIRENPSLMRENLQTREFDIHTIFFKGLDQIIAKEIVNDGIVETIRCLTEIFHKVKRYGKMLDYSAFFQQFKKDGTLTTNLSLRQFQTHMKWIKTSPIAPNYKLNFKLFNVNPLHMVLRFNPLLNKRSILQVIESLPFLIIASRSRNDFSQEFSLVLFIPQPYLRDFLLGIQSLEEQGYLKLFHCFSQTKLAEHVNLNYLREYGQKFPLLDPDHPNYDKKYELQVIREFGETFHRREFTLFDFLVMERIQWYSYTGLGFERKNDILQTIKNDLLSAIESERVSITTLKERLTTLYESGGLLEDFISFIETNRQFGFFYIQQELEQYCSLIAIIEKYLKDHSEISNLHQLQDQVKSFPFSPILETNILIRSSSLLQTVLYDIFKFYFTSQDKYLSIVEKFNLYTEVFALFYRLKIYSISAIITILHDPSLIQSIFQKKQEKLKSSYETFKIYQITRQKIDDTIDKFIDPGPSIITPALINLIDLRPYVNEMISLILKYSPTTLTKSEELLCLGFSVSHSTFYDYLTKNTYIRLEFFHPLFTTKEKKTFISLLYSLFRSEIISVSFFLDRGFYPSWSLRHFYDFETQAFFYTEDLFSAYFLYVRKLFGDPLPYFNDTPMADSGLFWEDINTPKKFLNMVTTRGISEPFVYSLDHLTDLSNFHEYLSAMITNPEKYEQIHNRDFFTTFIKSIRFLPAFQYFGFSQYMLYIRPSAFERVDLKLLLLNTFQNIKHSGGIGTSTSLLIKYLMPYGRPNTAYLNRLVKSERVIGEYCLFSLQKVYILLQFDSNLGTDGWDYDPDRFKKHMQKLLFDPSYTIPHSRFREYDISSPLPDTFYDPHSPEFKTLKEVYGQKSINLKSHLGSNFSHIADFIKKKLIFPYITLKNLRLHNKVTLIIPAVSQEHIDTLLKIFNFFNYGFLYEIQGEYYIKGFPQVKTFEHGLMVKLYLPHRAHNYFLDLFDLLFSYFKLNDYVILSNLVDGQNLVKSIYSDGELESYIPLTNLIWNLKDKIWMNHKLFNQKMEKLYPPLN
ncbi:MAG: hypothetical protein ACFFEN_08800 [Candidatus Thorarchaeota archaeon]